jgi:DNA-binding transcriptional LysR family regulator
VDLLDHMRIFNAVAKLNSFSGAAREIGIATPTVSRSIARLETHLNANLFFRTTRTVSLTDAGHEFFDRCVRILASVEDAIQSVADSNVPVAGHLRVHTPTEFGKAYLIPLIARFRQANPSVTFDLTLGAAAVVSREESFDVFISKTPLDDEKLIVRSIGTTYSVLCASPDYLERHGTPVTPEDLIGHECINPLGASGDPSDTWSFEGPSGSINVFLPPSSVQFNTSDGVVDAVCSGLGIGCVSAFLASQYLNDGRLIRILPKYHLDSCGIHVAYRAELIGDRSIRRLIAFLVRHLPQSLDAGLQGVAIRQV